LGKIIDITMRLVSTNDKKNIMTEAKELFHDPLFIEKLDTNPYLLCFENGVVDFKEKVFRNGYPEDYVSKSTKLEYIAVNPARDAKTVDEINDFMRKLFPKPQLCEYMWCHLASILLGTPDKQTFHMYIGEGRNGKSVLTTLIDEIMGEYKGVVPLSAITQDRAKVGGTSAELAELKGVRYAVIMEPSTKDSILEGPLKQLTSGLDPIQCRAPYSTKTMIYYPQFKLVLCTNVRMEVKTQDFGTWRRIREVPFESHFTEKPDPSKPNQFLIDTTIQDKFAYWKFTFMAMLVKKAFETGGKVEECDVVIQASKRYQESQDFIAEFIRDKIVQDPNGKIKKAELNVQFTNWYRETYGHNTPSPKDVHVYMDKKFGKSEAKGHWAGVSIKYERPGNDDENDSEEEPCAVSANDLMGA
jgi:P4 family phage/plasmid primase-like protien